MWRFYFGEQINKTQIFFIVNRVLNKDDALKLKREVIFKSPPFLVLEYFLSLQPNLSLKKTFFNHFKYYFTRHLILIVNNYKPIG